MSTETEQKAEKPRGTCTGTGCGFEYTLSLARSGEFKGMGVIRKHNSRVGPGLCEGAQKPPKPEVAEPEEECACAGGEPDCPNGCWPTEDGAAEPETECGHVVTLDRCLDCGKCSGGGSCICPCNQEEESSAVAELRAAGSLDAPVTHVDTGLDYALPHDTGAVCSHENGYEYADHGNGHSGSFCRGCGVPESVAVAVDAPFTDPAPMPAHAPDGTVRGTATFDDPAPMPAELPPVSGQPEPNRDRWGRYLILGQSHTRATSFAKLGSSTYALAEWGERMLIKGLTERPDLLALAHGLDVKRDKKALNSIADDAQTHAGNKVAANIGTAYHAFTERLDADLITLSDVPPAYRARCEQYVNAIRAHGLTTRAEWIERTTGVRADQVSALVPVAGTLDRIWQLPNGDLVIGDLKTGSDLSYGWAEIAVQLAIYAHGCNTHGLFDWNTKTWQDYDIRSAPGITKLRVRTDYAIVMHLPADGDGCTLYRVDLVKGWKYAQVSGEVQTRQKDTTLAGVLVPGTLSAAPPVAADSLMDRASRMIDAAVHADELITLLKHAGESGRFTDAQIDELKGLCGLRWEALQVV